MTKQVEYSLPCGCYLKLIPSPSLAWPPNQVEQFTCEIHADVWKWLEAVNGKARV